MAHIDQNRSFEDRLRDFGPELGPFLRTVWDRRASIHINSYKRGRSSIYRIYTGDAQLEPFDDVQLKMFISQLRRVGAGNEITCQDMKPHNLAHYNEVAIDIQGMDLWKTFFHVIHKRGGPGTTARAYVHAIDWGSSLKIMELIIRQFGKNQGLWEVKTAGPGQRRLDTIVAYFFDRDSRNAILQLLKEAGGKYPGWFVDSLPPLVKREGKGIGSADNPPTIEIFGGEARHSFGSFYATIAWLALRTTPNLLTPNKEEPRHFLDNVLYCLRLLQVDPAHPQDFPAKDAIEAWYQNSLKPVVNT